MRAVGTKPEFRGEESIVWLPRKTNANVNDRVFRKMRLWGHTRKQAKKTDANVNDN